MFVRYLFLSVYLLVIVLRPSSWASSILDVLGAESRSAAVVLVVLVGYVR